MKQFQLVQRLEEAVYRRMLAVTGRITDPALAHPAQIRDYMKLLNRAERLALKASQELPDIIYIGFLSVCRIAGILHPDDEGFQLFFVFGHLFLQGALNLLFNRRSIIA
ncbi:hypothetical protein D3C71_1335300 [compost metagenome]